MTREANTADHSRSAGEGLRCRIVAGRAKLALSTIVVTLLEMTSAGSLAQEPINAFNSATHPARGSLILRQQFHYVSIDDDPSARDRQVRDVLSHTILNYGVDTDLALSLSVPLRIRWLEGDDRDGSDRQFGADDLLAVIKWRPYREDLGPLDTRRFSLLAGMEIRSGDTNFSSDSYDPLIGAAYTAIIGRHGLNFDAAWQFTTNGVDEPLLAGDSQADLLRYDAAYLYRIAPAVYGEDSQAAWYALVEWNGYYETNGDHEVFLAPGLMYEARRWVFEFSVQFPAIQELDHRPETEFTVVLGLRFYI